MRREYGVCYPSSAGPAWALMRNRRQALRVGKFNKGRVCVMTKLGHCATVIADYREADPLGGKVG